MLRVVNLIGLLLLMAVGYHYINAPLGFSPAGSAAAVVFAGCLLAVYPGYVADGRNWLGWSLIAAGCLLLAAFDSWSWWLPAPAVLVVLGFKLADLSIEVPPGAGGCHGGDGGGDLGCGDGGNGD